MKTSIVQTLLHLLCCALILFPHSTLAGAVIIPGFRGSVAARPAVPVAPAASASRTLSNRTLTIPGFYNRASLPVVPANKVPVPDALRGNTGLDMYKGDPDTPGIATTGDAESGQVTVYQYQPNAIINWQSFDIGSNSSVYFEQKGNANWVALNRIWDANPSQIYGRLTADGRIYLINQNGILFGPGSRLNVNSLVASALNIKTDDFLNNNLRFIAEDYQDPLRNSPNYLAAVSNYGEINAAKNGGGHVFLIAPRVDNAGLINAPTGQIGLVAGTDVTLLPPGSNDTSRSGYYVIVNPADFNNPNNDPTLGSAVNWENGELRSNGGMVGMYGNNVDQWGIIRSVTAYQNKKGQVELRAANKITTGPNSSILLPVDASVDPETGRIRTVDDTFDIQPIVDIKGLQTQNNEGGVLDVNPVNRIELQGSILAPTGTVTASAADRVYLDSNSRIDVSGVKPTADLPMPVIADVKLTSVELRDYYAQKDGVLQGEEITASTASGSAIGDLSQVVLTRQRTALERSIGGAMTRTSEGSYKVQSGSIDISAANGDIIVKQGAVLDVSGGTINYAGGTVNSTKLLSGTKIYDISNAPANILYDKILGNYTKTYDRFGIRESYSGLYCGGASPLMTYVKGYTQGGDAGRITLAARTIVLDGQINAGVATRGIYQNTTTNSSDTDALALSVARGLEAPRAGTLTIKGASSISVVADRLPQSEPISSANVESYPQQTGPTVLSAKTLNAAGLGTLELNAVLDLTTDPVAILNLQPGGRLSAQAGRMIDHEGTIRVPAGTIEMRITGGLPPDQRQRIVIGSKSGLDVSGERIDNTRTVDNNAYLNLGLLNGGSISIIDMTDNGDGVFMASGAVVDVSGGHRIDRKGKITGGNAGALDIQGVNIMLNGDLRGYALADPDGKLLGGKITLTSANIDNGIIVTPAKSIPQWYDWSGFDPLTTSISSDMKGKLYLAADRFDDTGFTRITLNSMNNVTVDPDATISPSLVRLNSPLQGHASSLAPVQAQESFGKPVPGRPDLIRLDDSYAFMAGPSSFSAGAGVTFVGGDSNSQGNLKPVTDQTSEAKISIGRGAVIRATRNAKSLISLNALNSINMAGTLDSPGGKIALSSGFNDLTVEAGATISVAGYNRRDPASTPKGYDINYQPISAGSVVLGAAGDLVMKAGSSIDISGSPEVPNRIRTADGKIVTFREAGDSGSLSLSYGDNLAWNGDVKVDKAEKNIKGGSLTINRTHANNGLEVRPEDIRRYQDLGFDDLTLKSRKSLLFSQGMDISLGRKLTLDAPEIRGSGPEVTLKAPWIVLTNTYLSPAQQPSATTNASQMTLSGRWIDVIGSMNFSGYNDVTLEAVRDIRLSQALYDNNVVDGKVKNGMLTTTGNLVLDADRIYPGNYYSYTKDLNNVIYPDIYSDFTVHADGKVTVQNSHTPVGGPIYSAGGNLIVEGLGGIEVKKGVTLAAPLGTIKLSAPGQRIYLAAGSVLRTAGNTEVNYGGIDPSNIWVTEDKTNPQDLIFNSEYFTDDSLPQKGITLDADTTVAMEGSEIDVHGGGSVFAYKFLPGVEGSVDPLTKPNRYVAIKSDTFALPGQTVHLKGAGLSEGMYTLLPLDDNNPQNARYAFMPGAYIIEAQSGTVLPGAGSKSKDGYPLATGYKGVADTSIRGTRPQVYSVRTADEVLKTEGNYVKQSLISGDGGNIGIKGNTIVLDGSLKGSALPGYHGGAISLSGQNIFVQASSASPLPADFGFGDVLDPGLRGKLTISGDTVKGFRKVELGDVDETEAGVTKSITVTEGAALEADIISLTAAGAGTSSSITIENGARLTATTGDGEIDLTTPGSLLIDTGATVHAANLITLDVNDVADILGNLQSDNGALRFRSDTLFFGSGGKVQGDIGLYLTANQLSKFTGFNDITFASRKHIEFRDDFALSATDSLTLDAARILDSNANGPSTVALNSAAVTIRNSGAASTTASSNAGTFTVNATDRIDLGGGDVLFGGFKDINLNSTNDLTLKGQGNLKTGGANLHVTAARVVTASDSSSAKKYIAPKFIIDAGSGAISMSGNGTPTSSVPGGLLEITGRRIELATVLQSDGGTIQLTTRRVTGFADDGIFLYDGGKVLARGTDDAPGGKVLLTTDYVDPSGTAQSGKIELAAGSLIDVSAGAQGDAGVISLKAPKGGVTIDGSVMAAAQGSGKGGSFSMDTDSLDMDQVNQINRFTALNEKLKSGGFTESLDIRARTGDVTVDSDVNAHRFKLTADGGMIDIAGNITADGADGGRVELYAMNDVNIGTGGNIRAVSASSHSRIPDVNVLLSSGSDQGSIHVDGEINVSDSNGNASGVVYLRAKRNNANDDVNIYISPNKVTGATAIYAEAVKSYDYSTTSQQAWITDAQNFSGYDQAIATRLGDPANFYLLPGIELYSSGDINWNTAWDAISRFGGEPGVLTLRAARNLTISQNLTDHSTTLTGLNASNSTARDSWGFNLVAGADMTSADHLAVIKGKTDLSSGTPVVIGDLNIADQTVVYTESAPIHFASSNDTVIGSGLDAEYMVNTDMTYNLASFDGPIHGNVGRDLIINGGVIQTATGDIDIHTGRDVQLNTDTSANLGAIRTTGRLSPSSASAAFGQDPLDPVAPVYVDPIDGTLILTAPLGTPISNYYWRYVDGGDITLDVGGSVGKKSGSSEQLDTAMNSGQWDYFSKVRACLSNTGTCRTSFNYGHFSANYGSQTSPAGTRGLAAMGGGDLSIRTGGDFLAQAGTFGTGDLTIQSVGDIKGRLLNKDGQGEIHAMGNFGAYDTTQTVDNNGRVQIELFESQTEISAMGEMQIGAIVNPDLASSDIEDYRLNFVKCSYEQNTSINLKAGGDVTLAGISPFYRNSSDQYKLTESVLPATVSIDAGGDIDLLNNFTLTSSPAGNLRLAAGGDIKGPSPVVMMSDIAPGYWYDLFYIRNTSEAEDNSWSWITDRISTNNGGKMSYSNPHGYYKPADADKQAKAKPLHSDDPTSIEIHADGDISDLIFYFPKKAEVTAGGDITDIIYEGQNIDPDDVSMIKAGGNISMKYVKDTGTTTTIANEALHKGLILGGPGVFMIQAGGSIDLGTLQDGVQAVGNGNNPMLGTGNSRLVILSGYGFDKPAPDVEAFFNTIRTTGDEYAGLMAEGKLDEADELLKTTRNETIDPLLAEMTGAGDINMTSTQIATSIGKSDVFVIANGDLNLGQTALPIAGTANKKTGITTGGGGEINIFARKDVNVQESRIMTFFSREDVIDDAVPYGEITVWSDQGNINAGRGSRTAVSASPAKRIKTATGYITVFTPPAVGSGIRAATYGDNPPEPGNIHLFAPSGIIDAGEAGIAGGQIILAALQVNNAANISFSVGSIGMPQASGGAASLGTLAGSGSATQNSQLTSEASSLSAAKAQAAQMVEDIVAKWLEVKVIDFVEDETEAEEE